MKMKNLRILSIGDVVGEAGTLFLKRSLSLLKNEYRADMVIVNGENSARQNGIDIESAQMIFSAGADIITTGNHVFKWRNFYSYLDGSDSIIRPANFAGECPGKGYTIQIFSGYRVLVMNLAGTLFMENIDNPFNICEKILSAEAGKYDFAICDLHAEATAEKAAFAKYFDSRIAVIFGTHTHVQTSDIGILKGGTAFITDLGMCGAKDSVLGTDTENAISRFRFHLPSRYEAAGGECILGGAIFEISPEGKALEAHSFII